MKLSTAILLMLAASASANSIQAPTPSTEPSSKSKKEKPTKKPTNRSPSTETSSKSKKEKPTKKPTNRSPSTETSSKSTKKPTKKPTRKPTRKPTKKPSGRSSSSTKSSKDSSSRDSRKCVDDENPRPVNSDKGRFRFKLVKSNARCVDDKDRLYEYGEFKKVREFSDCAEACVNDVRSSLLDDFRGFDWNCYEDTCRCLYDRGTLDSRNSGRFDRTNRSNSARGSIEGAEKKRDFYCAKLAGAELFEEQEDELQAVL